MNQHASVTGFFGTHRFSEGENCWSGRDRCKSVTNIQESVRSTVHCEPFHHQFKNKAKETVEARSGRLRPSTRYLRSLQRSVEREPRISAADLSQEMQLSLSSVRRYLGRLGYKGRAARRKPLLRPANIARRYRWTKEMIKKSLDFW